MLVLTLRRHFSDAHEINQTTKFQGKKAYKGRIMAYIKLLTFFWSGIFHYSVTGAKLAPNALNIPSSKCSEYSYTQIIHSFKCSEQSDLKSLTKIILNIQAWWSGDECTRTASTKSPTRHHAHVSACALPQSSSHSPKRNPRTGRTSFPGRHVGQTSLTLPVSKVTRITRRNFDPPSHVPRLPVEQFLGSDSTRKPRQSF
jgi:hypothetical protein